MTYFVRMALPQDSEVVQNIISRCFKEEFDDGILGTFLQHWPDGQLVACAEDGTVVSFLCGALIDEHTTSIALMAVLPEHQHNGIGSVLVDAFEQITEQYGGDYMQLEVRKDNEKAVGFYSYLGFNENMEDLPGYYSDGTDAIRMGITTESYLLPY